MNANVKSTHDITITNKAAADPVHPHYATAISKQTPQQQLQSMQQHSESPAIMPPMVNNREDPNVWESRKIVSGTASQALDMGNRGKKFVYKA